MKRLIFILICSIIINKGHTQEAALQLGILNSLTAAFKEAEAANDKAKMAKLAKQIEIAEKTFKTTEQIYSYYEDAVKAVETVSSLIKTSVEVKEFFENVIEIADLYSKYGVGYSFGSLYDFDPVLDPKSQEKYMMLLKKLYNESLDKVEDMRLVISDKSKGGVGATEYERWIEILELHKEIREINRNMKRVTYLLEKVVPVRNKTQQTNIEFKKSFFSYETYD